MRCFHQLTQDPADTSDTMVRWGEKTLCYRVGCTHLHGEADGEPDEPPGNGPPGQHSEHCGEEDDDSTHRVEEESQPPDKITRFLE